MNIKGMSGMKVVVISTEGAQIPAYFFCFDHGHDLQFYSADDRKRIPADSIKSWILTDNLKLNNQTEGGE